MQWRVEVGVLFRRCDVCTKHPLRPNGRGRNCRQKGHFGAPLTALAAPRKGAPRTEAAPKAAYERVKNLPHKVRRVVREALLWCCDRGRGTGSCGEVLSEGARGSSQRGLLGGVVTGFVVKRRKRETS